MADAPRDTMPLRRPGAVVAPVWPLRLVPAIALLGLVAAGAGLFWRGGFGRRFVDTVRGQTVAFFGVGPYRYDTVFAAAGARGTDAVTLLLGVPLLLLAVRAYQRGSLTGGLACLGALGWFLYAYAGFALGATAYNELFLVYVALFSLSLFAFIGAARALTRPLRAVDRHLPRRLPGGWLIVSGAATWGIWLLDP